jgi:hypothetical protein
MHTIQHPCAKLQVALQAYFFLGELVLLSVKDPSVLFVFVVGILYDILSSHGELLVVVCTLSGRGDNHLLPRQRTPSPPTKKPADLPTTAQASKHQQPTTSKPTTPRSTRKDNKSPAKELQPEPKREFQLQTAVKAGGGKFVHDVNNDYGQYRKVVDGFEYQFTIAPECEECFLGLVSWAGMYPRNQTICLRCRTRTNRSRKADSAICTWRCPEHGIEVGTCCIPVVLRTRLKEST